MEIKFFYHPSFEKETAKLSRRFSNIKKGLQSLERLCRVQFHPEQPQQVINPGKIHRVTHNDLWEMWKVEMATPDLRPSQFPRVWFAVKGSDIAFLCIATHIDSYSDNEINKIAVGRVSEIF